MSEEVEKVAVEAEVLEEYGSEFRAELAPASIADNVEAVRAFVEARVEPFVNARLDCGDAKQLAYARKVMADLNKLKEPIEAERKRVKREYEAPLKAFEARVKEITSLIDSARAGIKAQVDAADAEFKESRRLMLQDEYEGMAGALAGVIPFWAVLDPSWLNRSTGEVKAVQLLQERVVEAAAGYELVDRMPGAHHDELVRRYCETLDLAGVRTLADELDRKDREMAEFKAAQEEAERVRRENLARLAAQPLPDPDLVQTRMPGDGIEARCDCGAHLEKVGVALWRCSRCGMVVPEPDEPPEQMELVTEPEPSWWVRVDGMTERQVGELVAWCRARGLHGTKGRMGSNE